MTGVTSGLGVEWLYELDRTLEAEFFLLARSENKFHELISNRPLANEFHLIRCDFASFEDIDLAAKMIEETTDSVDILINNAGVWAPETMHRTVDGVELTFAVNHLAPYILTGKLILLLNKQRGARIINTASFRHKDAEIDKEDIQAEKEYDAEQSYCNSKLFSVLFTRSLSRLLDNGKVTANCFDPGIVDTPMFFQGFPKSVKFLYPVVRKIISRTPLKGAETGVFLSTSSSVESKSGRYYKNCKETKSSRLSNDPDMAKWLWTESEKLTGFCYPKL